MPKSEKLRLGLILNKEFHQQNRWVVATTPYLVNGILDRFDCCWIESQHDYENCLGDIEILLSLEPGWAAPKLDYSRTAALREKLASKLSYIMYSDPHDAQWREDYFLNSGLDFILAYYYRPTLRNFPRLSVDQIVHFPCTIPDVWIRTTPIVMRSQKNILVFGASNHEAYSLRNWCRTFPFVESSTYSGVENKNFIGEDYLSWLAQHDAVVAAGSDDPRYRLTTPKYFEIAAAGSLLFAQETDDLEYLGFRHFHLLI